MSSNVSIASAGKRKTDPRVCFAIYVKKSQYMVGKLEINARGCKGLHILTVYGVFYVGVY